VIINAVILVPQIDHMAHIAVCTEYCQQQGYRVESVIKSQLDYVTRSDWEAAASMREAGLADVIVMARPEHFDPAWETRVEFASDLRLRRAVNTVGRRTRVIRPRTSAE
jgi:2,4-dienoyl-CoA reductase-like NADH-dependent reductase (Old Yellow Enzyme family)